MSPAAERLETDRLVLRQLTEADFDAYAELCADPDVMRFLGGKILSRPDAWRHLATMVGQWRLRGFGAYAAVEKASGAFAGRIGFNQPEGWPGFEVGWTLKREHWGKGLASEAAARCLEHAFTEMERDRVISLIHPDNEPSRRVAARIGERPAGTTELPDVEGVIDVWAITADEWRSAHS